MMNEFELVIPVVFLLLLTSGPSMLGFMLPSRRANHTNAQSDS